MAVYEVYSHPELRRYKTQICSKASFVLLICLLLTWIPPLLIAYRTQGFWQRIDSYEEQPNVQYQYQLMVIMTTSTNGSYICYSTYSNFNSLELANTRIPLIKSQELDVDGDGLFDELHFQLSMPLMDTEQVYSVQVLLMFDYLLQKFSYFEMESMVYMTAASPVTGASLQVVGDLALAQTEPLDSVGTDSRYNTSVINSNSIYAQDYEISRILYDYSSRNVTTFLKNPYQTWISGRGAGKPFVVNATIHYPVQYGILYYPGFWQMIKGGWVQYVAILAVFWFIFRRIKTFIYSNQLVTTVVERPFKTKVM